MKQLARNLSLMRQSWLRVAAIVVSEMKERLSPKKAPPITTATRKAVSTPMLPAISVAKGVRATTVPTDVPMETEMKQAEMKIPGIISCVGSVCSARATVASIAPMLLAREAKAPARMKIHIIYNTLALAAPREKISIRFDRLIPWVVTTAQVTAKMKATETGTL